MLKGPTKHRTRELLAVYVEPHQVEVQRAHRQWRTWQIDSVERSAMSEGEGLYDHLQRLNLRPRSRKRTALLLFLPRSYYNFHREHYPGTLQDQLEEALNFDWQENIFYEQERTLHFFGPAVPMDHHVSVPIFSLQRDVYEKFKGVMGGESFETFTILPTALTFSAFLPPPPPVREEDSIPIAFLGRIIDPDHLEVHRFYEGTFLDSTLVVRNEDSLRLFRESLQCLQGEETGGAASIQLICTGEEYSEDYGAEWRDQGLPIQVQVVGEPLISLWLKRLLDQELVRTFDTELMLKPWEIPKVTWPVLALITLFSIFALYQVHAFNKLQENSRRLKKQTAHLETQWKPIEQLQTRISKFQEDQKTLSEFNAEGYPLLDLLNMLSQATAEDTWLNYLSLRKGQLMLRGESKSAIKYLSELSKVEGFSDVRFASPVTRNPASDMERFNLQLQIELEKLKKTIASMPVEKEAEETQPESPEEPILSPAVEADPMLQGDEVRAPEEAGQEIQKGE